MEFSTAMKKSLHRQNIIACIWDFDKTLIPGYMQSPIFKAFEVDEDEPATEKKRPEAPLNQDFFESP